MQECGALRNELTSNLKFTIIVKRKLIKKNNYMLVKSKIWSQYLFKLLPF